MSLGGKPAQFQQKLPAGAPPDFQKDQFALLNQLLGGQGAGLEQFFGPMGSPATPLQRQATGGIEQFLNQPAPEQRALETSLPALQAILNGNPGAGVMDALRPHFERNLSSANQQGGRFGSANAVLRSRAVDDFNLLGAQAAERGQQTQLQAAQMLSLLANSAGDNPFRRLWGAANVGQADAQQADLGTQRRMALLSGLLSVAQNTAFNAPWIQTKQASSGWGPMLGGLLGAGVGFALGGPAGAGVGANIGGKVGG